MYQVLKKVGQRKGKDGQWRCWTLIEYCWTDRWEYDRRIAKWDNYQSARKWAMKNVGAGNFIVIRTDAEI